MQHRHRPTVSGTGKTIEVNLFDFNTDIYGEPLRLFFEERIRDEQRFTDVNALKEQLQRDEAICRTLLA